MKTVIILLVIAAFSSQLVYTKQFAQKLCRTEEDCDWDQCCIDAETRLPGFNGICSNPTEKGEICNPDERDKTVEGRYKIACPCKKGLTCLGNSSPNGEIEQVCQ